MLQNTSSRLWIELGNNRDGSSPVSTIYIEEYTVNITITTYKLLSCPQLLMHRYHHPIKYRCMHRRSFGFQAHVTDPRHFAIRAIRSLDWSLVSSMKEKEITETHSSFLTPASINTRPSSWEPRAVGAWLVTWAWWGEVRWASSPHLRFSVARRWRALLAACKFEPPLGYL
jgi:hypothetical protein